MIKNRNTLSGSSFEDDLIEELNDLELFAKLGRSSIYNVEADKAKIDIVPIKEDEKFGYNIQAKMSTRVPPFPKLLSQVSREGGIPVVIYKQTERVPNDRFLPVGIFSIMYKEDFVDIISALARYKEGFSILSQYFDSISDEEQPKVHKKLLKLEL